MLNRTKIINYSSNAGKCAITAIFGIYLKRNDFSIESMLSVVLVAIAMGLIQWEISDLRKRLKAQEGNR